MLSRVDTLLQVYVGIGLVFVLSLLWHPYPGSFILKPIPVLIMAALCWQHLEGREQWLMALGFAFSAAGDVFLDVDRIGLFKQGLLSFLVTQILFSIAFFQRKEINAKRILAASGVGIYAIVMIMLLWSSLGDLKLPVLVYILALTSMGGLAALREGSWLVYIGGFLFVIADSLIAVNKFLMPFDHSLMVIITLYMSGQYFIGKGVLTRLVESSDT